MQAYAIPSFQFDIKLYRTNRPPHSAVRAPGKFQSPLIMEHIIEHVAARLDMDPVRVREINFMEAPEPGKCHKHFKLISFDLWLLQHHNKYQKYQIYIMCCYQDFWA